MRAEISFGKSLIGILCVGLAAAGCTTTPKPATTPAKTKQAQAAKVTFNYTAKDRECLKRAMYFESQHSDEDGYLAVGTVVMNRLTSGAYPPSICGVVAQEKQFAPGVMTREVKPQAEPELATAADAILLKGARHPAVKDAMFFHTDGLKFPYDNMHYVTVAGGNAFYEKRDSNGMLETPPPLPSYEVAMNYVPGESMLPPQFDALIPSAVPVPLPAPDPMATASTAPMRITAPVTPPEPSIAPEPGMPIAIPTPRPAYDSVMLRGELPVNGG
ncbi:cell wall hydrolase [Rhizobium lentis]|uniref:Spore germination cell wall hydrolase CwlJ-like protein n=1 Tax=Rhizobium lentis TaxID=1138194 RepID=A0A7W8XI87_9HYPH|nr:cell wall hydrolase [Rhizobium lentis]MBB4576346.1 spore germination cell wall hydrolase CwlJ-like protein [Rhizobium lentis]MBB5552787.1 spore germination cell wall hydrolase CwlJ-like protein [Rhizobium lentis]MBB5563327.1 spore germination cell wall hydrolase CwlJ-like protein [Rhizobium lentis]MBB5569605.1 spore germination cell wall hydrolase CwlJ-like protein [Rhizobium lentis]